MTSIIYENQVDLITDNTYYKSKDQITRLVFSIKKHLNQKHKLQRSQKLEAYRDIEAIVKKQKIDFIIYSDSGTVVYPEDSSLKITQKNLHEGRRSLTKYDFEGLPYHSIADPKSNSIHFYIPLNFITSRKEILLLKYDINEVYNSFNNLKKQVFIFILGIIILFILFGIFTYSHIVSPLGKIFKNSLKISSGNYSVRINSQRKDELGLLSETFDKMTVTIEKNVESLEKKILEIERAKQIMEDMALTDELTGLYNRRAMIMELKMLYNRAQRSLEPMAFIMLDIDHFKKFNDTYGHQTGDVVLKEVSKTLIFTCREMDFAARYGGEELCVIAPGCSLYDLPILMERIRRDIEDLEVETTHGLLKVTVSIGGVSFNKYMYNAINDSEVMISFADMALYRAKESGRNRVKVG